MKKLNKPCVEIDEKCAKESKNDSAGKRKILKDEATKEPEIENLESSISSERVDLQSQTVRFIGYIIVALISFAISMLVLFEVMKAYLVYEKKSRFPSPATMFLGSFLTTFVVAYVCYLISAYNPKYTNVIFWMFILFNFCYIVWFLNLSLRANSFTYGVPYSGKGSFYLFLTVIFSLAILWYAFAHSMLTGILMLLANGWIMFLLFVWLFDGTTTRRPEII